MFNDQLEFITPRPHWATSTDVAGNNVCAHIRDFSVGDVTLEIRQEDRLVDGHVVYGVPQVVAQIDGQAVLTPPQLMRLAKAFEAAAHQYARIGC